MKNQPTLKAFAMSFILPDPDFREKYPLLKDSVRLILWVIIGIIGTWPMIFPPRFEMDMDKDASAQQKQEVRHGFH